MTPFDYTIIVLALLLGWMAGWFLARRSATTAREAELSRLRELARQEAAATASARQAELDGERVRLAEEGKRLAAEREAAAETEARADRAAEKARVREQSAEARERQLATREDSLDRKLEALDQRDTRLRGRELEIEKKVGDLETRATALEAQTAAVAAASAAQAATVAAELARVAGLTPDAARAEMMAKLDVELATEQSARIAAREKELQTRQKELAVEIVSRAVQRYAAEHTAESTSYRIKLPDEEFKGRIIGKEGRNIKAFEQLAGVDVVMDDTPNVIQVSCFDPIRREVARRTLELLIEDGRIQPARIEEILNHVRGELERETQRLGEDAAYGCEVSGLHPQLIKLLGKLQFRTSYGQNVLLHSQEAAFLCGAMAADIGLDAKLGRRCGLLHDVGKAIDHEQEGSHPQLGYEALKRCGESEIVANAALAHHEGHAPISAYTVLAAAADAISAARPGARRANVENYLKRLAQLEEIAVAFPGVQKAYAIQAGRELRVLVNQHTVPDAELSKIGRDITRAIGDKVAFPGEIKVTLIRETRHIAIAR